MSIKEKDSVIFYCDEDNVELVQLIKDDKTTNKKGIFLHNDIIGKNYGIKVYDTLNRNFIYILKRSPELIASSLKKKTQILFEHDISFICLLCNAIPNKKIVEAGTGTGCLTYALANAVFPHGKVYTFEYNKERYDKVTTQFEQFENIKKNIQFYHKDIINTEWEESIRDIDSVVLDLPNPWLCVQKVRNILKERGIFVIFLPCIEQVQKTINALEAAYFCEIVTYELLHKSWGISQKQKVDMQSDESKETKDKINCDENSLEKNYIFKLLNLSYRLFQKENKTHTGYITVAKKMLDDENDQIKIEFKHCIN